MTPALAPYMWFLLWSHLHSNSSLTGPERSTWPKQNQLISSLDIWIWHQDSKGRFRGSEKLTEHASPRATRDHEFSHKEVGLWQYKRKGTYMQREVGHRSSWTKTHRGIDPKKICKQWGCNRGTALGPMQMTSMLQ